MPANWGGFQAAMNSWFCGDAEGGEDYKKAGSPTAKKIADKLGVKMHTIIIEICVVIGGSAMIYKALTF